MKIKFTMNNKAHHYVTLRSTAQQANLSQLNKNEMEGKRKNKKGLGHDIAS